LGFRQLLWEGGGGGEAPRRSGSVDCGGGRRPRWGMGVSFPRRWFFYCPFCVLALWRSSNSKFYRFGFFLVKPSFGLLRMSISQRVNPDVHCSVCWYWWDLYVLPMSFHPASEAATPPIRSGHVRCAGAGGCCWSSVRGKHCWLASGWRLLLE